ncbi:MAG: glycoside hydrolase family 2 protein [Ruminococcaceae bacterium]|nr:glycoside hydrolase family 2 protein [Oscillospiraceae bacterium]
MNKRVYLNDGWEFTRQFGEELLPPGAGQDWTEVRLPHTCAQMPYDYFDESIYQMVCHYRRTLDVPASWAGKRLLLTIGAAGHRAEVYLDGTKLAEHRCGYTAFQTDLTDHVRPGGSHTLSIKVDSRESLDQPPFGYVIDYMTYGGLYREVWLDVKEPVHIVDVFAMPRITCGGAPAALPLAPELVPDGLVESEVICTGLSGGSYVLRQTAALAGAVLASQTTPLGPILRPEQTVTAVLAVPSIRLWDTDNPCLYTLTTELLRNGEVMDTHTVRIGFRDILFAADGFYLNGIKRKLRGLNRHQSYPYVGYAMPASMQRLDADILKNELGVNAVRTSHYPQSRHFIDRCDELGLLVFTEIPGWQHIGGEAWKRQAVQNTADMVRQYRNHPSVILWGVRINESGDDDALYAQTNAVAHRLDPTRPTGGVRYSKKSHLLEDVYTYNDFLHDGTNRGCEPKRAVTPDMDKAYLISEYNGHMFPTKQFDSEYHLLDHALRHAAVLDAVAGEDDIAGSFGWCMFDYNTHRDFGSGDRICYHGVMDMYRNPKPAAAVYAAQQEAEPVLEITSRMDIGEHPSGNMGRVYIITNADSVRMYRNNLLLHEYTHGDSPYKNLRRGPILITDYIGSRLEQEGYGPDQTKLVRDILNHSAIYGFGKLPPRILAKAARAMAMYHMTFQDAYRLYSKYIGSWGDSATTYRFEAVKDGRVVKTVVCAPVTGVTLRARADHTALREISTYDVAAVRVSACDQNGHPLPFFHGSVELAVEGPIELIGPRLLQLRGGCGGTYVKTTGRAGEASLTLTCDQAEPVTISFRAELPLRAE